MQNVLSKMAYADAIPLYRIKNCVYEALDQHDIS